MKLKSVLLAAFAFTFAACATQPAGVAVGSAAPAFSLPAQTGGTVALADYRDQQPVLLFFHMADG